MQELRRAFQTWAPYSRLNFIESADYYKGSHFLFYQVSCLLRGLPFFFFIKFQGHFLYLELADYFKDAVFYRFDRFYKGSHFSLVKRQLIIIIAASFKNNYEFSFSLKNIVSNSKFSENSLLKKVV